MTIEEWINANLLFDRRVEQPMKIATIVALMRRDGVALRGSDRHIVMTIGRLLKQRGGRKDHDRNGNTWYGFGKAPRIS